MHIAFLNPQGNFDPQDSYWTEHPDFGGQLVYVKEVAVAMSRMGHKVDVVTRQIIDPQWPEFAGKFDHYPQADNLRIIRLPCGPDHFLEKEQLWPYIGTDWVNSIIDFYGQERDLPQLFTTHYGDGGLAGVILKQKTATPFTFTGHSLGAQKMDKLHITPANLDAMLARYAFEYRIAAERLSMNYAARIFTSTNQERYIQYGHQAYQGAIDPQDNARFAVTPPGVNRTIFSPSHGKADQLVTQRIEQALDRFLPAERKDLPLVISSSRLDKKKNHIGTVRAFSHNPELREQANLAIVVRGLEDPLHQYDSLSNAEKAVMDEIVQEIADHHLEDCVFAFPLNNQEELAAAYRYGAAHQSVFILTTVHEPFGLAPLEAMSCGLPAVVTKHGGPSESMRQGEQEFGVLVDPVDPADVAKGILRLVSSPQTWEQFHQAGIQRVIDQYTWDRTTEGYLKTIQDILTNGDHSPSNLEIPPVFTHPSIGHAGLKSELEKLYF